MHSHRRVKHNEDISKPDKRVLGRTDANDTPLEVHGNFPVTPELRERARALTGHALGHNATAVERAEVWFEDVNGPKGGVDVICRITLAVSGVPNVFAEARDSDPHRALALAAPKVARALKHALGRRGRSAPKLPRPAP